MNDNEIREEEMREERIRVVYAEPGKMARYVDIENTLEGMQKAVGGYIEVLYFTDEEPVCIVCNEEGKLNGLKPSRAIFDEEHRVVDIICGPFFICDCSGENFGSLNAKQLDKYGRQFECPEHYYRINDNIVALPYVPSSEMSRMR